MTDRPHTVLVVDDDADWRQLLCLCLDDLGYQTLEASNGREALETLSKQPCSVMLLDMRMPEMSGEEVLQRLPEDPPRVVCLTSAPAHEVGRALQSGPHYYLPKGATREQLALLLESLEE